MPPKTTHSANEPSSITGVKHVRKIPCEARCACAVDTDVWVAERTGSITVRHGRTGEILETISTPHQILGTAIAAVVSPTTGSKEVWVGTQSGVIHVISATNRRYTCELLDPNVQHGGEIHQMVFDQYVFVATQGCRVVQWDPLTKEVKKSFVHEIPVFAAVTCQGEPSQHFH